MKSPGILVSIIVATSLFSCKTQEIILHGEISGLVTDTTNSQPLQAVTVKLKPINDTISTSSEGKYLFKSLNPGDYKIETSKRLYATETKDAKVTSANPSEINFALSKIAYPEFSERHLDFGFDSTLKSFTIKNTGTGTLQYSITASQDWISVSPNIGDATTETDSIKVTINRTGLSNLKHIESIEVVSHVGQDLKQDTIGVYLNGEMDQRDFHYYGVITIGTQTWLSENLNIGTEIGLPQEQVDNDKIEKWCYDCKTYGGLYNYFEATQYSPNDTGSIGTTQGICPVGWHIPTPKEFDVLVNYAGGFNFAGGKLKEAGYVHWLVPNTGATDDYGFTALPGGNTDRRFGPNGEIYMDPNHNSYYGQGISAYFWSTVWKPPDALWSVEHSTHFWLATAVEKTGNLDDLPWCGDSVRCIKDTPKK
jgi:uncharacterized protein (TIGR02145 family)